jgi:hypothetical protein
LRTRIRRTAIVAAAAGLLAVLPGTSAYASIPEPPQQVVVLSVSAHGVPRALKEGQTIDLTIWYRQNSGDVMSPEVFSLAMRNAAAPASKQTRGVTVSWLSPLTNSWQQAPWVADTGLWGWGPPSLNGPQIEVPSEYWAHIDARITFSRSAYTGVWHLTPEPAYADTFETSNGAYIGVNLQAKWPQYAFTLNR